MTTTTRKTTKKPSQPTPVAIATANLRNAVAARLEAYNAYEYQAGTLERPAQQEKAALEAAKETERQANAALVKALEAEVNAVIEAQGYYQPTAQ